jgi:hypothetical protein
MNESQIESMTDEELQDELDRREFYRGEINQRIWQGGLEVSDGEAVLTMSDLA